MEANELRIGNWYFNGRVPRKVTPNEIEALWESPNRPWIQPIPLTEDILVKATSTNFKTYTLL